MTGPAGVSAPGGGNCEPGDNEFSREVRRLRLILGGGDLLMG